MGEREAIERVLRTLLEEKITSGNYATVSANTTFAEYHAGRADGLDVAVKALMELLGDDGGLSSPSENDAEESPPAEDGQASGWYLEFAA